MKILKYIMLIIVISIINCICFSIINKHYTLTISSLIEKQEPIIQYIPINIEKDDKESDIIGIKNNNPCNIKGKNWEGSLGNDKFGHCIFKHYFYSLRACAITLITYQDKYKLDTIEKIIDRYCTGNKKEYSTFLANRLGIKPTDKISVKEYLPELVSGIVRFETGKDLYSEHDYVLLSLIKI